MDYRTSIEVKFVFSDEVKPFLLDISSLLYDLELLYDIAVIISLDEYADYKFTRFFWYRNGRTIKDEYRIRTIRIIKDSPLTIELIFGAIEAFWLLIQAIEKIDNWRLNRQKLKLEVGKMRKENQIATINVMKGILELEKLLKERQALDTFNSLKKRLESNPIKLQDIEILESKIMEDQEK
jgi:hypothetical protein